MKFDYDPEDARTKLIKIIKITMAIDLAMLLLSIFLTVWFLRQGGGFLVLAALQIVWLLSSGRSFLRGIDELEYVKTLKLK